MWGKNVTLSAVFDVSKLRSQFFCSALYTCKIKIIFLDILLAALYLELPRKTDD